MKKTLLLVMAIQTMVFSVRSQTDSTTQNSASPHSWNVKQAWEVESLVPMFATGGYHFAVCYRYEKFRFRVSVINGGSYDAETAGIHNSSPDFKRFYKTSPGLFAGYNIWRNLELYTYLESHTFEIQQVSTGLKKELHSTDVGGGISYQFFLGRRIYLQPGLHIYLRGDKTLHFTDQVYTIPNMDLSPVFRLGYRLWSQR